MIILKTLWGHTPRPWGYEIRADFSDDATSRVFNEILGFDAEPGQQEIDDKVSATTDRLQAMIDQEDADQAQAQVDAEVSARVQAIIDETITDDVKASIVEEATNQVSEQRVIIRDSRMKPAPPVKIAG
jgi:hypothetical protein